MDATVWSDGRVLVEAPRFIAARVDLTSGYGKTIPPELSPFDVEDVPTTVVVGSDGHITARFKSGAANAKDVAAALKSTL